MAKLCKLSTPVVVASTRVTSTRVTSTRTIRCVRSISSVIIASTIMVRIFVIVEIGVC